MYVPFETLPATSRIWIYQSDKIISDATVAEIRERTREFIETWTSHQAAVKGSFKVEHGLFLIIGVDEDYNNTGGCSIDSKVRFIRQLESDCHLNFFDRLRIAYLMNDKASVVTFNDFSKMIQSGELPESTLVFNNLVSTKKEMDEGWKLPFNQSWHRNLIEA